MNSNTENSEMIICDLNRELTTSDYIYTKDNHNNVNSLGFNISNFFLENNIPILTGHKNYTVPAGIHLFIPTHDSEEESFINEDDDEVISPDIYETLLDLQKNSIPFYSNNTKNVRTRKKKLKKKHSRKSRKNFKK